MFFLSVFRALLFTILYQQFPVVVYSQTLTLTVETSPFKYGNEVTLKCLYSGPITCCSSSSRVWRRDGTHIMSDGVQVDNTKKYEERVNAAGHYFELKIFNLGESDFGKVFQCQYGFSTSNFVTLTKDFTHGHSLYDLCPSNWTRFADSCYYPSTHGQVHNFHTAATFCNGHSSHLVEIDSQEEQVFMEKLINKTNSLHDFWIGANDIDHEGIWKWNGSNTVLNYSHWCTGEPNNALQGEDCAALNVNNIPGKNFCWNDYSCKSYHYFVCEKSISAVSTTTHTHTQPTGTLVWRTVARH